MSDFNSIQFDAAGNEVSKAVTVSTSSDNGTFGLQINHDAGVLYSSKDADAEVTAETVQQYQVGSEAGTDSVLATAQNTFFKADAGADVPLLKVGDPKADNAVVTLPNGSQTTAKVAADLGFLSKDRYGYYSDIDGGNEAAEALVDNIANPESDDLEYTTTPLNEGAEASHQLLSDSFDEPTQQQILSQMIALQSGELDSFDAESFAHRLGDNVTAEQIDSLVGETFSGYRDQVNSFLSHAGITTSEAQKDFARHCIKNDPVSWKNALRNHYHTKDVAASWKEIVFKYTRSGAVSNAESRTQSPSAVSSGNKLVTVGGMQLTEARARQMGLIK